jgi:hypothetical protein
MGKKGFFCEISIKNSLFEQKMTKKLNGKHFKLNLTLTWILLKPNLNLDFIEIEFNWNFYSIEKLNKIEIQNGLLKSIEIEFNSNWVIRKVYQLSEQVNLVS